MCIRDRSYRAGIAAEANGIPEAIRQGIVRMTQHLHDARDGAPCLLYTSRCV